MYGHEQCMYDGSMRATIVFKYFSSVEDVDYEVSTSLETIPSAAFVFWQNYDPTSQQTSECSVTQNMICVEITFLISLLSSSVDGRLSAVFSWVHCCATVPVLVIAWAIFSTA